MLPWKKIEARMENQMFLSGKTGVSPTVQGPPDISAEDKRLTRRHLTWNRGSLVELLFAGLHCEVDAEAHQDDQQREDRCPSARIQVTNRQQDAGPSVSAAIMAPWMLRPTSNS